MANDYNDVRYNLDESKNFKEIVNSPWYSDAVYSKFSEAEYQRRYKHARELMRRDGLDALILTGGQNIYSMGGAISWATNLFDERGMCQYAVLPMEGEIMLIYPHSGCHIEAARKMASVKDVRSPQGDYAKTIADRLRELGLEKGRIGITVIDRNGPEYMGARTYLNLLEELPDATFEFMPQIVHELTRLKSAEEIEAIEVAGELVVKALEALIETARPGVTEYQLAAAATYAIMNGNGRVHLMMIGSTSMEDPTIVFPNPIPSERVLKEGDIILNEMVAIYKGYSAKIGHPITVGPPTEYANTFFKDVVLGGFKALEATLMPGNDLEDIRKAGSYFREAGAQSRPVMVHGIDMITALPFIYTDRINPAPVDGKLEPGNLMSIEITPINADGTFGMFMGRTYLITEDGHRQMAVYPMDELISVDV